MAEKFSIGIIGVGMMGRFHIDFLQQTDICELKALCNRSAEAFDRVDPEIRKDLKCYTNADEFFADPDFNMVLIATPHPFHAELAVRALQHNKHVMIEKPVAVQKAEAEKILAEAAKHPDLAVSVMFNQRTWPLHCKVKEMLDNGELGKILRVNWVAADWFRTQHYYNSGSWRASWAGEGGGVLLNQCSHQLDLLEMFFGLPEKVRAVVKLGKYHDIEVEDDVNALLEYADGKIINFISSTGETPGINRLEIIGEQGVLVMENEKLLFRRNEISSSRFIREAGEGMQKPEFKEIAVPFEPKDTLPCHGYLKLVENTVKSITNGEKLIASLASAARSLELGNAILYAGLLDCTVTMPLDAEKYSDMLGKLIDGTF